MMETPEEFVDVLGDGLYLQEGGPYLGEDAGLLIRARDNAIRLALLDELEAHAPGMIPYPLREQLAKLRLKYTQRTAATETDLAGLDPHTK